MKQKKWLWIIVTVAVAVALVLLWLCTSEKEEKYDINHEISYTSVRYFFPASDSADSGPVLQSGGHAFQIVHNAEELSPVLSRIAHFREITATSICDLRDYDDGFFKNNALLLVEVYADPGETTVARPENLVTEDGKATLTVKWGTDNANAEYSSGALLLITIPPDCTQADVDFEFVYQLSK